MKKIKLDSEQVSSLTCFHLRPHKGLDRSLEPQLHSNEYINESLCMPGFTTSLDELKNELQKMYTPENRIDDFPKILFLGTGSCIPNKTRNVSSILVHTT